MNQLAWGKKVSEYFILNLVQIVQAFGWTFEQASHLMACIAFESAETFSPSIKNAAGSGAVGLIQFMPKTAVSLGTTVDELEKMTAVSQLIFVQKYFLPYHARIHTLSDMYMAILLPRYIGREEDAVLFTDGHVSYRQNSGLDKNSDGRITKAEAASLVQAKLEKGLRPENVFFLERS